MPTPDIAQPDERLRQSKALELHLAGKTYAAIAEQLGYADPSGPRKAVDSLLKRVESPLAEDIRRIQDVRLEALWESAYPDAIAGDEKAREFCVKLHNARVKLHGANAPERLQVQPVGLTLEAFTTTVSEDVRMLGLHPQMDVPLTEDDPDGEPWANTGDIGSVRPPLPAPGGVVLIAEVDPPAADNETGESDPPLNPAVSTPPGHTLGTPGPNRWAETVGGGRATWADISGYH